MADHDAWIDTILKRSQALRAAGVLTITVGDCSATLAPAPPEPSDKKKVTGNDPEYPDVLHDAASYPSGIVPGYDIKPLVDGEDF